MAIQKQSYQIQGMRQDNLVGTGYSSRFAHEIMNMRLNTIGDYTTASWTTEKGTKHIYVKAMNIGDTASSYSWFPYTYNGNTYSIEDFQPIGQANINDEWILFGIVGSYSVIINLHYTTINNIENLLGRILYWGDLGFDIEHPIETITFYENEKLQKVYWTDGLNQPRVINIKGAEGTEYIDGYPSNIRTQFDFTQEVSLNEEVEITKNQSGVGLFPPCTVKYAISYYKQYGQETNIVYDSPLYYPTIGDRACSEDELSGDSFYIKVKNIDTAHGFDYIRLYSIIKTSNNATPIVRIVEDKPIKDLSPNTEIIFHDTNTTGEIIDPAIIQFIGGKEIVAHTFDQKNNTLFLGNIELKSKAVTNILENDIETLRNENNIAFSNSYKGEDLAYREEAKGTSIYQYINQLNPATIEHLEGITYIPKKKEHPNSQYVKHFKYGETYRFGIQFQDSKGAWSEVIFLRDLKNDIVPYTAQDNTECLFAGVRYTLNASIVQKLLNEGYKKTRLVCCYPTNTDRSIIAQGVICPTVYNNHWKELHAPDVMSSWFFRPNDYESVNSVGYPHVLPWKNNAPLDCAYYIGTKSDGKNQNYYKLVPEIQSTYHSNEPWSDNDSRNKVTVDGREDQPWTDDKSVYKVNREVLTFHSPELEFDETLRTLPSENWNVRIIGKVPFNSFASKYFLDANSPSTAYSGNKGKGLLNEFNFRNAIIPNNWYGTHSTLSAEWNDINLYTSKGKSDEFVNYCIYPFQRKGSLNNYFQDIDDWTINRYWKHSGTTEISIRQTSTLHSKVLSHIVYSATSIYGDITNDILNPSSADSNINSSRFTIFDSNEVIPIKIKCNEDDLIYYGNVNGISPISDSYKSSDLKGYNDENDINITGSYPIGIFNYSESDYYTVQFGISGTERGVYVSDPVSITYKSTPHGVFFTKKLVNLEGGSEFTPINFTLNNINDRFNSDYPFLYLAEVYIDRDNDTTRFGGDAATHHVNNIYVPCGPTESLTGGTDKYLLGLEGDTYFMRYDNLKTYPYATDDTNQIVEILSFMVETRINLDGRYDKNRGLLDNTMINNTNFNLINKSYTQDNNTFTFLTLDKLSVELDYFANQFTWTKEKVSGEKVDAWTNITLASTADAEGTLGSITKILNYNDRLVLFQDHGLAQISFNENTAISTESGVPLELAKTGKYTGLNYYTREIGCQNKWSISKSKNGLLWIDDSRQELLTLGENIQSVSTANGFDAFMIKELPSVFESWNPGSFNNFVTYYDKLSNDVYYINSNYCLAWNEQTGTFTSFYNYENVPYMMNIGQHSLMWNNGIWAARESEYNIFFDNIKDYWMTIVCDGQTDKGSAFPADKVFNNIEYRADIFNMDYNIENNPYTNYNNPIFNIKHVWNGYQNSKEVALNGERKFNIWRVQLPRHHNTRDRIRNPFCYIKLKHDQTITNQTDRAIIHDLAVYFDMK